MLAPRARSTPRSPRCANSTPARFLSGPIRSFPVAVSKFLHWRRVTPSRTCIPTAKFVEEGGLMSYGNDTEDSYRRAGVHVGRVLNGASPADLPVDQATKFELVVNIKAA